jgi:Mg-chelatase subunit ChlD
MKNILKKVIVFILISSVLSLNSISSIGSDSLDINNAIDYINEQPYVDFIFVVDFSGSMNSNDTGREALQMIGACIDTFNTAKTRVAIVAYSETILKTIKPSSIETKEERNILKNALNTIERRGNTDIGLALKEAEILADISLEEGRKANIILFSDGEPALSSSNKRTVKESYDDMNTVAGNCADKGIIIDSVAFGNFDGSKDAIEHISSRSGGKLYIADTPDILISVCADLIDRYTFSKLVPISITLMGGQEQKIDISYMEAMADEVSVLVISSEGEIRDATMSYSGESMSIAKASNYFTAKIKAPNANAVLSVTGDKDQSAAVYIVGYKNYDFRLSFPKKVWKNIEAKGVIDFAGQGSFYDEFDLSINKKLIKVETDSEEKDNIKSVMEIIRENNGSELNLNLITKVTGKYLCMLEFESKFYNIEIKDIPLDILNSPPKENFIRDLRFLKTNKKVNYNLLEYFTDENRDKLEFSIEKNVSDEVCYIENDNLYIDLNHGKNILLSISAIDVDGAMVDTGEIEIRIEPFWVYYKNIMCAIIIVIVIVGAYLIVSVRRKYKKSILVLETNEESAVDIKNNFSGKFNVYFTKMPNDMEVSPLTFALYQIKEKTVLLEQLFVGIDIFIKELDLFNIRLTPGKNGEVILVHQSSSDLMMGTNILCRQNSYSMEYGMKLYITSADGEFELELHYLSERR